MKHILMTFRVQTLRQGLKIFSLLLLSGSLLPVLSQTCAAICADTCGPPADSLKGQFNKCMHTCEEKCLKCQPITGSIFPKYYILGLVYAPPGCTGAAAQACATQSSVDYANGSSMGTKISIEKSQQWNYEFKLDGTLGNADAKFVKIGLSGGWGTTSTDTNSQTVSKGETSEIKAIGIQDGVNHDQDKFILLLNPEVAVQQNSTFNGVGCSTASASVSWLVGLNSALAPQLVPYEVSVAELKNPALMPANVAQQFQILKFTTTDYQTILAQDPFANGATAIDTTRFVPTTSGYTYAPPAASDCSSGTCFCPTSADAITNSFATEATTASKKEYNVGATESGGLKLGPFTLGASAEETFTWSTTATNTNTTSSSQTATVTVACPSPNYSGPTVMLIYWDTLYGSFLFVPTVIGSPQTLILTQGTVTSATGQAMPHQPVAFTFAGKTFHTYTDSHGKYVMLAPAGIPRAATGQLSVLGVTTQAKLGSTQQIKIPAKVNASK